jgi:hypothetical protein
MIARRLGVSTALVAALILLTTLAGCGGGAKAQHVPTLSQLPLVPGSKIAAQARQCDRGSAVFCAIELVVFDRRYRSSDVLARDESRQLRKLGWSLANGDTAQQSAANSPGHKLRLTFATAIGDLEEIDLGLIQRPRPITLALSSSMFDRTAAMSMMLEVGAP